MIMNRFSFMIAGVAGLTLLALTTPVLAADAGKEITISGQATCAKCGLKEADKCQTVIQTEAKNGTKVNYYLTDNDVAKNFHENVCQQARKATATGTARKVEGKKGYELTATKISLIN